MILEANLLAPGGLAESWLSWMETVCKDRARPLAAVSVWVDADLPQAFSGLCSEGDITRSIVSGPREYLKSYLVLKAHSCSPAGQLLDLPVNHAPCSRRPQECLSMPAAAVIRPSKQIRPSLLVNRVLYHQPLSFF